MEDLVNRFARELADAIAAAVAQNPQVEACREKAREAGFEMKVTHEAVVGFANRSPSTQPAKAAAAPATPVMRQQGPKRFGPGSTIEHAKWGRGTVLRLEGTGEDAKVTVSFPGYGLKKLIAKYAGIKVE